MSQTPYSGSRVSFKCVVISGAGAYHTMYADKEFMVKADVEHGPTNVTISNVESDDLHGINLTTSPVGVSLVDNEGVYEYTGSRVSAILRLTRDPGDNNKMDGNLNIFSKFHLCATIGVIHIKVSQV